MLQSGSGGGGGGVELLLLLMMLMLDDTSVLLLQSGGNGGGGGGMELLLLLLPLRMRYSDDCGVERGSQRCERRLRLYRGILLLLLLYWWRRLLGFGCGSYRGLGLVRRGGWMLRQVELFSPLLSVL